VQSDQAARMKRMNQQLRLLGWNLIFLVLSYIGFP